MSTHVSRAKRGFTLVELLVVIGIIALLISMLLPALNQARQQAQSTQCLAQLRQCGQILYIYANENHGYFPQGVLDSVDKLPSNGLISSGVFSLNPGANVRYPDTAYALNHIVQPQGAELRLPTAGGTTWNPQWSLGGMKIFFCPSNYIFDDQAHGPPNASSRWPEDFAFTSRIRYNYLADPNPYYPMYHYAGPYPSTSAVATTLDWRYWDRNHNGTNRDEYMVKVGDKNASNIVIMVDSIRFLNSPNTNQFGIALTHGKGKSPWTGWLNELYGDGHAGSKGLKQSSWTPDGKHWNHLPGDIVGEDELQPSWGNGTPTGQWIIW
jgi:prepilin-type N-terminal cleavage/methylation domain-containing protein